MRVAQSHHKRHATATGNVGALAIQIFAGRGQAIRGRDDGFALAAGIRAINAHMQSFVV